MLGGEMKHVWNDSNHLWPKEILNKAIEMTPENTPIYALFSGGHDSLVSTHIASLNVMFRGVVHANTGIGIEETRQFVRDTCAAYHWPLFEIKAAELKTPQVYSDIVCKLGFPGPAQHHRMYRRLKERCLREFKAQVAYKKPFILCTGIRKQESKKRQHMAYVVDVQRIGQWIWAAPCVNWSEYDIQAYMKHENLPRNPVKDKMCISGECLCGAFARPEERAELRHHYPAADAEISRIEALAKAAGVPCKWGQKPPENWKHAHEQMEMFMPLCSDCQQETE
jgi:3'-phosphoadenosine 5'-phosphosulfate sulfotransferase (PAPS reductase)/FAD synthetase